VLESSVLLVVCVDLDLAVLLLAHICLVRRF
jgi:hypothetical protein